MKSDQKVSENVITSEKMKIKNIAMNNSKVGNIVAAIESNIKKSAEIKGIDNDEKKVMNNVENAFQKLMNANNRGDTTPSPGIKKRRKRIGSLKPHGMMKIDEWMKNEK